MVETCGGFLCPTIMFHYKTSMKKKCKTKKIRSTRKITVQRKQPPTTFNNWKHLKGCAKIPIPKQIEDEEHDMKQT